MSFDLPRDFKGIWIPKLLWTDKRLSFFEKCLAAEIDSLDGQDHCYASNEYFCKFFNITLRTLQRGISHLKSLGIIEEVSFTGRERRIKSNLKYVYDKFDTAAMTRQTIYDKFDTPDMTNLSPLPPRGPIDKENKEENKEEEIKKEINKERKSASPPVSQEPIFQKNSIKMKMSQYEKLVQEFGKEKTDKKIESFDDYSKIRPDRFKKYKCHYSTVRTWIRDEKPDNIYKKELNPSKHLIEFSKLEYNSNKKNCVDFSDWKPEKDQQ